MMMVMHLLKLTQKPQIDASDALAIALCHPYPFQPGAPWGHGAATRRALASVSASCADTFCPGDAFTRCIC
jgi:hypothetical protein